MTKDNQKYLGNSKIVTHKMKFAPSKQEPEVIPVYPTSKEVKSMSAIVKLIRNGSIAGLSLGVLGFGGYEALHFYQSHWGSRSEQHTIEQKNIDNHFQPDYNLDGGKPQIMKFADGQEVMLNKKGKVPCTSMKHLHKQNQVEVIQKDLLPDNATNYCGVSMTTK